MLKQNQEVALKILNKIKDQIEVQNNNFKKIKKSYDSTQWNCEIAGIVNEEPYVIWEPSVTSNQNTSLKQSVQKYKNKHGKSKKIKTKNQIILSEKMTDSLIQILEDYSQKSDQEKAKFIQPNKASNNEKEVKEQRAENEETVKKLVNSVEISKQAKNSLAENPNNEEQEIQIKQLQVELEISDDEKIVKLTQPKTQSNTSANQDEQQNNIQNQQDRDSVMQNKPELLIPTPLPIPLPITMQTILPNNSMLNLLQNSLVANTLKPQNYVFQNLNQIQALSQNNQIQQLQQQVQQLQQQNMQFLQNQLIQSTQQNLGANYFRNRNRKLKKFIKNQSEN